jgi:hypothetical protein
MFDLDYPILMWLFSYYNLDWNHTSPLAGWASSNLRCQRSTTNREGYTAYRHDTTVSILPSFVGGMRMFITHAFPAQLTYREKVIKLMTSNYV